MMVALLSFLTILAWGALGTSACHILLVTFGRWAESPMERKLDELRGRHWPSRTKPLLVAFVASAWLYSTWGV